MDLMVDLGFHILLIYFLFYHKKDIRREGLALSIIKQTPFG